MVASDVAPPRRNATRCGPRFTRDRGENAHASGKSASGDDGGGDGIVGAVVAIAPDLRIDRDDGRAVEATHVRLNAVRMIWAGEKVNDVPPRLGDSQIGATGGGVGVAEPVGDVTAHAFATIQTCKALGDDGDRGTGVAVVGELIVRGGR